MGGGSWCEEKFRSYSVETKACTLRDDGSLDTRDMSANQLYKAKRLNPALNPYSVIRECKDSEEHPNTLPVILALDITGSMGQAAVEVAEQLNVIMTELYKSVKDVEFMIMGVGDFSYDISPLQVSQFESDIRIAEQLDKLYFEFGGGPNSWESYSAAWAFAAYQTDCDCWNRGKKGIIITMGDEMLNPYIPGDAYERATGSRPVKANVNNRDLSTSDIFDDVKEKYNLYHIDVDHRSGNYGTKDWEEALGSDHVFSVPVKSIAQIITEIIKREANCDEPVFVKNEEGYISW